jgi:hypothetical protein
MNALNHGRPCDHRDDDDFYRLDDFGHHDQTSHHDLTFQNA